jgi:uncharacterized protein (DUF488 family)
VPRIFTIGYERRTVAALVLRLREAGATRVIDVRARAASPRPGFSKGALAKAFGAAGLAYVHLAEAGNPFLELAASDLDAALAAYRAHLAGHPAILDAVLAAAGDAPSALLCAEASPRRCHRGVLADALRDARGVAVVHL